MLKPQSFQQISPNIYISGLPLDFTESDLYEMFSKQGGLEDCVVLDQKSGRNNKAGFANFESTEDSRRALEYFSNPVNNPLGLTFNYSKGIRAQSANTAVPKLHKSEAVLPSAMNDSNNNVTRPMSGLLEESQPIIDFPETPKCRSRNTSPSFERSCQIPGHLPRNIHYFNDTKEKRVKFQENEVVISVRNIARDTFRPVEFEEICNVCGGPAKFRCGRCKSVLYCDEECQVVDHHDNSHFVDCVNFAAAHNLNFATNNVEKQRVKSIMVVTESDTRSRFLKQRSVPKNIHTIPLRKPRHLESPGESSIHRRDSNISQNADAEETAPKQICDGDKNSNGEISSLPNKASGAIPKLTLSKKSEPVIEQNQDISYNLNVSSTLKVVNEICELPKQQLATGVSKKSEPVIEQNQDISNNRNVSSTLKVVNEICELPKQELATGDTVLLVHGNDPLKFYAQKISDGEELLAIGEILQSKGAISNLVPVDPKVGLICSALFIDELWYRVRIQKILDNGKVSIFYIDYGNESEVDVSGLKPLPKELLAYSPKAFCLRLKIQPLYGKGEFPNEVCEKFHDFINQYPLIVKHSHQTGDIFLVDLQDEENNNIAKLLVDAQLAAPVANSSITQLSATATDSSSQHKSSPALYPSSTEHQIARDKSPTILETKRPSSMEHFSAEPKIPTATRPQLTQQNVPTAKEENVPTAKEENVIYPKKSKFTLPKQELKVGDVTILAYGKDPSKFYVHKLTDEDDLYTISVTLQTEIKSQEPFVPEVGAFCVAQFEEDNMWYRGEIIKIQEDQKVDVRFVDYGNEAVCRTSDLRTLPQKLFSYSAKAIRLQLKVKPLNGASKFSPEEQEIFFDFINGFQLTVKELTRTDCGRGFIVDLEDKDSNDIADFLVQSGLFDPIPVGASTPSPSKEALLDSGLNPKDGNVVPKSVTSRDTVDLTNVDRTQYTNLPQQSLSPGDKIIASYANYPSSLFVLKKSDVENLNKISEFLKNKMVPSKDFVPVTGNLCVAKYTDGDWYRGLVKRVTDTDNIEVFFVDYGNSEVVKLQSIAAMPQELMEYPATGYQIRLSRVKPAGGLKEFSEVAFERIAAELLHEKFLTLTSVTRNRELFEVQINNKDNKDLAEILVNEKLAEYVETPKPAENVLKRSEQAPACSKDVSEARATLPKEVLQPGLEYEVTVTWVSSPKIHVTLLSKLDDLERLQSNLSKYANTQKVNSELLLEIGDLVCGKFEADGNWYRCKVLAVEPDALEVFFIDYGNTDKICKKDILPLPKPAFKFPSYSHCVSIEGVEELSLELSQLLFIEKWKMKVVSTDDVSVVTLKSDSESANKTLKSQISPVAKLSNHEVTSKQQKTKAMVLSANFETGAAITLKVIEIWDTNALACRIVEENDVYENLIREIQEYCSKTSPPSNYKPMVRDFVLAKNPSDGIWYRASVVVPVRGAKAEVYFIDSASYGSVSLSNLLPMTPELAFFPSLGLLCSIHEINEDDWENILKRLQTLLKDSNNLVKANVRNYEASSHYCAISIPDFNV